MSSPPAISASVIGVWLRASRSRIRTALMTEVLMTLRLRGRLSRPAARPGTYRLGPGSSSAPRRLTCQACERARVRVCQSAFTYTTICLICGGTLTYIGTECEHPQVTSQRSRWTRARALVAAAAVLAVSVTAACSSAPAGAVKNTTLTVAAFNPFTGGDAAFGPEM